MATEGREYIADHAARSADTAALTEVAQAAHDLLCWTYQHCINVEPADYSRNVSDLHPGVWNSMNAAEQRLYAALIKANEARAKLPKEG